MDREFEESRQALEAKRKNLRKQGKGLRSNAAQPLKEGEEELLYMEKWRTGRLQSYYIATYYLVSVYYALWLAWSR